MTEEYGILYGVGVGPGDPDLLTLKAVQTLGRVESIFASSSTKNGFSLAESIVRPHLQPDTAVMRLQFPMTSNAETLELAWTANAETILKHLAAGEDVALVTLGDPLLFSTFGYVLQKVRQLRPEQRVEIIPGITSFQQAAAATGTILAEAGETLHILPGTMPADALRKHLDQADNSVILKAYRNFGTICDTLDALDLKRRSLFVSRLGLEGELICRNLDQAPKNPHYLSLLLVKKNKN
ncbi:precorrin-2 C(20)-methyltransferase [Paucidesulfovibrio longus]|uniref:precorrin-2 C(20)-methyltransferase n=1 Tax=Paucidesulfovibrio longus TaxID=889 RepID=UPI0003B3D07E|nr:precorrin-2 C(20)-methyltransferase [Paucidesulfovibrio longus]